MIKTLLSTEIYSIEKVKKVCSIYSNLASIDISQNGNYIVLTFNNCKFSEGQTAQEFENFLIAEENI